MEPTSVFFLILFLAIFVLFVLNIARERAELLAARRPEGWKEIEERCGFYWDKGSATIGCIDNGVSRYVWMTEGDIPLEVLTAFCARAKEWKR